MSESLLRLLRDTGSARKQGPAAIERRQRARLAELVAFAHAHSPYYRALYQNLPERIDDPTLLPVTDKKKLMARFDDWATDRAVTLDNVREFIADPDLVGKPFLDKYVVATTSGTSGHLGIFVWDNQYLAVNSALQAYMFSRWLTAGDIVKVIGRGTRIAVLVATGGHFVGFASATRVRNTSRFVARLLHTFSVHTPLPDLVSQLNSYGPAMLMGYPTIVSLLAGEQEAGRLHINPVLVGLGAEGLAPSEYDRIATAFDTKIRNLYGATEFAHIAYGCAHGWLHVNSDWVVLEPVDADYRAVPPGVQSHTLLISNLANRVQPILRYDLGDSILQRPDPCPCGDRSPAIRVRGRTADMLIFPADHGQTVTIIPLAFESLVDRTPGIEVFQIVQSTPTRLRVRLKITAGADPDQVWQAVHSELTRLLSANKLDHVTVERAKEGPEQSPGGKYRTVIPLR
jgi:putative adenylate-forming enzyme